MSLEIISRIDAAAKGLKRFYTGRVCRNGHVAQRYVSSGACIKCLNPFRQLKVNAFSKSLVPFTPTVLWVLDELGDDHTEPLTKYLQICINAYTESIAGTDYNVARALQTLGSFRP